MTLPMIDVGIREITDLAGLKAVYRLFDRIWQPDPRNAPVTAEMLRALSRAGNYVAGAFQGEELVGASVGFFGPPAEAVLHSHITGVQRSLAGHSIGHALKLHQRDWALSRGVSAITWTFDPLVRRNAYFNLVKLGAVPTQYLTNFYGGMNDGINGTDETDRLLVRWELAAPSVVATCAGTLRPADVSAELATGAMVLLDRSPDGLPVPPPSPPVPGCSALLAVPRDIEALRSQDPAAARQWRVAVREALATSMAAGARVTGFDRSGWYVVSHDSTMRSGSMSMSLQGQDSQKTIR